MSDKNPFFGATFAERKALRESADTEAVEAEDTKAVTAAENKSVQSASTKRAGRRQS